MNPFFLVGGSLSIFLSVAHAFWGEKYIAPYHQITLTC